MSTPYWVSFELFQNALREFFNDQHITLLKFTSTDAVPKGDNFTSDLFRTTLEYVDGKSGEKHSLSVIVKCANEDGGAKTDFSNKLHLFDREVEMFTRTFPTIHEILGESYTFSSKCLYTSNEQHSILVLEDLTTLGFQMLHRHIGFDLEHCFKVLQKLARFHGASVLMYQKDPSLVKKFDEGLFCDNDLIRGWISSSFKALVRACYRWPGFEKYGYKIETLGEEAVDRGISSRKKKMGGFHVLNHGDLWVNNMMFSYDKTGKLKDMRFVDFQMNIFTSPAIDLHYFISTSTKMEVKIHHKDLLLDYYYAQLLATLAELEYPSEKIPTREELQRDFQERAFFGLMGSATVLPLVKASSRGDASFDDVMKDDKDDDVDSFRYHAYNNERYRRHMEHLLPFYDSFGVLD